jgi:hypothetical protein
VHKTPDDDQFLIETLMVNRIKIVVYDRKILVYCSTDIAVLFFEHLRRMWVGGWVVKAALLNL